MFALSRLVRPAQRASQLLRRNMSGESIEEEVVSMNRWKKASYFVAIPGCVLCFVNAFIVEPEDHTPPPFVPYEHLRIRTKKYIWRNGDRSLMHNPQTNATSEGYEEEYVAHH